MAEFVLAAIAVSEPGSAYQRNPQTRLTSPSVRNTRSRAAGGLNAAHAVASKRHGFGQGRLDLPSGLISLKS